MVRQHPVPMRFVGINDTFAESGKADELLAKYGLTAAVWTNDIKRALRAARRVQSGMVWVNGVGNHFKGTPYGGYKNSGVGKESCLAELLSYTEEKSIQIFL